MDDLLLFEIAGFLKLFTQGMLPQDQAKREAEELLEKIGRRLAQTGEKG